MKQSELDRLNVPEGRDAVMNRLMAEALTTPHMEVTMADMLEFRRDQYGLSRSDFCMLLGLRESSYSEVLSGKRRLPLRARVRAYRIGVPPAVLLNNY